MATFWLFVRKIFVAPVTVFLTDDEYWLLIRIANADGLVLSQPHLLLPVQRFGASGLVYETRLGSEDGRLYLTAAGKRLVNDLMREGQH